MIDISIDEVIDVYIDEAIDVCIDEAIDVYIDKSVVKVGKIAAASVRVARFRARFSPPYDSGGRAATPSFFCRLVEEVVYWKTRRLPGKM